MPVLLLSWLGKHWKAVLAGVACAASFAMGWQTKAVLVEAAHAKELQRILLAQAQSARRERAQSETLEKELAAQRMETRRVSQTLEKELENPVYADCRVPADGLRLLNQAIAGRAAR